MADEAAPIDAVPHSETWLAMLVERRTSLLPMMRRQTLDFFGIGHLYTRAATQERAFYGGGLVSFQSLR